MKRSEEKNGDFFKIAPHALEAEQAVLGGLMLDNNAWDSIAEILKSDDFYVSAHQIIFQALSILAHQNRPFDVLILSEYLKNRGLLEKVEKETYLFEIVHQTPSAANVQGYAKIVREKSILRKILQLSTYMIESVYQPQGKTADEWLEEMEKRVLAINQSQRMQKNEPLLVQKTLPETLVYIDQLRTLEGRLSGLATEFKDFDDLTTGLQPSDLIVIAGRPSMGKTTFAMNIAENIVLRAEKNHGHQKAVLMFSMEMSQQAVNMRLIASMSRIDHQDLRLGRITEKDWEKISFMMNKIRETKLIIDETPVLTPLELRRRSRRVHHEYREQGGLGLIIVDYLQLVQVPHHRENRVAEISEVSRALKALAKELNLPIIALSQINRNVESRNDKRPIMSDLKDSGSIEQDADVVALIYRDEVYNPDSFDRSMAEIIVAKQRNGPTGKIKLTFRGEYLRFENYSEEKNFFIPEKLLKNELTYERDG